MYFTHNKIVMKRLNGLNLPESSRFDKTFKLRQLSKELYSNNPPIYFIVGTEYSNEKTPGFMTIPYKFNIDTFVDYYNMNKEVVKKNVITIIQKYRSEERRVGKECLLLCSTLWSPFH